MNRLGKLLLAAGVLLVAAAIAGVAQPHLARTATASGGSAITVTGDGTVDATPDRASFDFGVTTQASTASQALSRNAGRARAIITALERAGVGASDIQTTDVSLWPQTQANGTQIVGYTASNSVDVTVPLGRSGVVVDAAVRSGADSVDGPSLDTAARSSLYAQALKQAVANARTKAQAIADASGLTLGAVVKVREGGQPSPIYYGPAAERASTAPPIQAGTQQIQASVTMTYSAS